MIYRPMIFRFSVQFPAQRDRGIHDFIDLFPALKGQCENLFVSIYAFVYIDDSRSGNSSVRHQIAILFSILRRSYPPFPEAHQRNETGRTDTAGRRLQRSLRISSALTGPSRRMKRLYEFTLMFFTVVRKQHLFILDHRLQMQRLAP